MLLTLDGVEAVPRVPQPCGSCHRAARQAAQLRQACQQALGDWRSCAIEFMINSMEGEWT